MMAGKHVPTTLPPMEVLSVSYELTRDSIMSIIHRCLQTVSEDMDGQLLNILTFQKYVDQMRVWSSNVMPDKGHQTSTAVNVNFSVNEGLVMRHYFIHMKVRRTALQKYPDEKAPNALMIKRLEQQFHDKGSVADRQQLGRAFIVEMKVTDVETVLQRSSMERPSVYINITTELKFLLNSDERYLGCSKIVQRVTHHGAGYLKIVTFRNNPPTLKELKSNPIHAISDIKSHTLRKVSINLVKKVQLCVQENGHHFEHLL
ncbi:uncharacterized protein TNCV_1093791 [Trichonephila clavipes]|uniref:Uncharacterized protein n=1 Tax=Trichonephila clavipes TaxID=2585209 RepID=A0A8X6RIZ0_TRICX|nr:uncharacterized protein TNCV_1093791 [Trichonephila clavipes]